MTIWSSPSAPAFWHLLLFFRSFKKNTKKIQTKTLNLHPLRLLFGTCCCSWGAYTALHTSFFFFFVFCIHIAAHCAPAFMYILRCTLCACYLACAFLAYIQRCTRLLFGVCFAYIQRFTLSRLVYAECVLAFCMFFRCIHSAAHKLFRVCSAVYTHWKQCVHIHNQGSVYIHTQSRVCSAVQRCTLCACFWAHDGAEGWPLTTYAHTLSLWCSRMAPNYICTTYAHTHTQTAYILHYGAQGWWWWEGQRFRCCW